MSLVNKIIIILCTFKNRSYIFSSDLVKFIIICHCRDVHLKMNIHLSIITISLKYQYPLYSIQIQDKLYYNVINFFEFVNNNC